MKSTSKLLRKIPSSYEISEPVLMRAKEAALGDIKGTIKIMNALSSPLRLRILRALRVNELCVCVFVALLRCQYSKLSYHLKLLKKAGLVDSRKDKNFLLYRLTDLGEKILTAIES